MSISSSHWVWFVFSLRRFAFRRSYLILTAIITLASLLLNGLGRVGPTEVAQFLLLVVIPLVALMYGGSGIRGELQSESLTFILARPLTRTGVYCGKIIAAALSCAAMVLPGLIFASGGEAATRLVYAVTALPCALAYTFVFALLSMWSTRPVWLGLIFLFIWESPLSRVPGFLGRLTLSTHVRALADLPTKDALLSAYWDAPPPTASLVVLTVVILVTGWLGGRRLNVTPARERKAIQG